MTTVSLSEAQARLPELVEMVAAGEEVVITRDDAPVAQMVPVRRARPAPRFGSCKGMLTIVAEDDEHLKDFAEYMP